MLVIFVSLSVSQFFLSRSPELPYPSLKSSWSKRPDLEEDLRHDSVVENKAPQETKPVHEAVQEYSQSEEGNVEEGYNVVLFLLFSRCSRVFHTHSQAAICWQVNRGF